MRLCLKKKGFLPNDVVVCCPVSSLAQIDLCTILMYFTKWYSLYCANFIQLIWNFLTVISIYIGCIQKRAIVEQTNYTALASQIVIFQCLFLVYKLLAKLCNWRHIVGNKYRLCAFCHSLSLYLSLDWYRPQLLLRNVIYVPTTKTAWQHTHKHATPNQCIYRCASAHWYLMKCAFCKICRKSHRHRDRKKGDFLARREWNTI